MHSQDIHFRRMRHGGFGRGGYGPGDFGPNEFGPGHGPMGPMGPRGMRGPGGRGRRRRGDVRLALVMLLGVDGPRNGYQLMQGLEERSDGRWRPSPGSVYPALAQLEDEGLIRSAEVEGESGRTFELTDEGRKYVDERGDQQAPWEPQGEGDDARAALRQAVVTTIKAARQVGMDGDAEQIAKVTELFNNARRDIYRVLAGDAE
jgi:DNA-binding PadR family transcriptional regulator